MVSLYVEVIIDQCVILNMWNWKLSVKKISTDGLSIKSNMIWNSAGSTIYLILQWFITILVVRLSTGYDAAGQLSYAMSFASLFAPLALYKIRAYQVSDVKHKYSSGEYIGFRIVTIAFSFALVFLYALVVASFSALPAIAFFLLVKAVEVFIDVLHGVDQLNNRMDYIGQSFILRGILSFLSFCIVLYFSNSVALAILSMFVVTLPIAVFFDWKIAERFESLKPIINLRVIKSLTEICLPSVLALFFCTAVVALPRQYLAYMLGDVPLGVYASVSNPLLIIQMGATYLYLPFIVSLSNLYHDERITEFIRLLRKIFFGILCLAAGLSLLFLFFGKSALVFLYGESISSSMYLMFPLLLGIILAACVWFLSDVLILIRSLKGNLLSNLIGFLAMIPLTVLLVFHFDLNGASFAIISAYSIVLLIQFVYLVRSIRLGLEHEH